MSVLSVCHCSQRLVSFLALLLWTATICHGWVLPSTRTNVRQQLALSSSTSTSVNSSPPDVTASDDDDDDDDDDDEYEYVEYDILTEPEFVGSEWLVGTVMESKANKISETWARLAVDKDGKNVAIWGDNSEGTWNFDVANQFLSFSKENPVGKKIWAGIVDDFYFAQGTVRGWSFFSAAAILGQWQAKRLGVDPDEAGVAPWFQEDEEDETPPASEKETESSE